MARAIRGRNGKTSGYVKSDIVGTATIRHRDSWDAYLNASPTVTISTSLSVDVTLISSLAGTAGAGAGVASITTTSSSKAPAQHMHRIYRQRTRWGWGESKHVTIKPTYQRPLRSVISDWTCTSGAVTFIPAMPNHPKGYLKMLRSDEVMPPPNELSNDIVGPIHHSPQTHPTLQKRHQPTVGQRRQRLFPE